MSDPHAVITERGPVITVTLNRPAKLNAIDESITEALWEAVIALRDREDLRVLVITGNGRYFSAGIDLTSRTGRGSGVDPGAPAAGAQFRRLYRRHHLLYDEIEAVEKPVVLAAQGPCLGAGLEMAVSCDFRLASDAAHFRLPEVALGTIAGSGGVSRLTRLVGAHWGKYLAMAGRTVDAQTARMIGLVHEIYPAETFGAQVAEFADSLVALPREALGLSKVAVDAAASVDRTTARDIERITNSTLIFSHDFQQRIAEFGNRNKP
ncbi:MAG: enoyl-CoA hydratase/isomerase family protein [Sphingobium sp.]